MEVVFVATDKHPVYGFEEKQADTTKVRFECPAHLTPAELERIKKVARDTFMALGCRDVARVDLRMAKDGTVHVIEVNPLPGLTPDFSDLCVIAGKAGMDHKTLIGEILSGCMKRHREARSASAHAQPATQAATAPAAAPSASSGTPAPPVVHFASQPPPKGNGSTNGNGSANGHGHGNGA
jgi:D-alanine-D-alanine ligase